MYKPHHHPHPHALRSLLRARIPSSLLRTTTATTTTPTSRAYTTPSLFNLAALSTARETHALSKASGLGLQNHSTLLQQLDAESRAHLDPRQRAATAATKADGKKLSKGASLLAKASVGANAGDAGIRGSADAETRAPMQAQAQPTAPPPRGTRQSTHPLPSTHARTKPLIGPAPIDPAINAPKFHHLLDPTLPGQTYVTREEFERALSHDSSLEDRVLQVQPARRGIWVRACGLALGLVAGAVVATVVLSPLYLGSEGGVKSLEVASAPAAPASSDDTEEVLARQRVERFREDSRSRAQSDRPAPSQERLPTAFSWLWQSSTSGRQR